MPHNKHKIISKPNKGLPMPLISFGSALIVLVVFWFGYKAVFVNKKNVPPAFLNSPEVALATPSSNLSQGKTNDFNIPSAEVDSDQDGLSDAMETLYKTNPNNPDTDGDGYKDGDEVANGYDPLIKSPNDKINRSNTPTNATISPLPSPSFTQQFVNRTGITPTKENLSMNETQVNQFINETNARGVLPIILDSDIKITNASGKAAIVKYLDTLSVVKNSKLKAVTPEQITAAFTALTQKSDPAPLNKVISDLENNAAIFRATEAPKEVVELHKKYLAAVLALLDDTKMLKNYKNDYVSALVAASRLEGLKPIFTEVEDEIKVLEKKYGIK
jgi:hypothetical protein